MLLNLFVLRALTTPNAKTQTFAQSLIGLQEEQQILLVQHVLMRDFALNLAKLQSVEQIAFKIIARLAVLTPDVLSHMFAHRRSALQPDVKLSHALHHLSAIMIVKLAAM